MLPAMIGFFVTLALVFAIGMVAARSAKRSRAGSDRRLPIDRAEISYSNVPDENRPSPDAMTQAASGIRNSQLPN